MRGSGLSLERFIKGKAHKTKGEAKSKKKAIIHKAQRRREYEKVKKREQGANAGNGDDGDKNDAGGPTSFYDRFFRDLKSGKLDDKDDEDDEDDAVRIFIELLIRMRSGLFTVVSLRRTTRKPRKQ